MDYANQTIEKTISMGYVSESFWDRWLGSGLPKPTVYELRQRVNGIEDWMEVLHSYADMFEQLALKMQRQHLISEAEYFYRNAAMNYYLIQWMFPCTGTDKQMWYEYCRDMYLEADSLAADLISEAEIQVEGNQCRGRVRIPKHPRGCVILLNPIDSAKEESFKFETGFAREGFATVSFDGPGQGETYVFNCCLATRRGWELFVEEVIEFAAQQFPELPLHLFGTSFGGSWAIEGGSHPRIDRVAAVSPVMESGIEMPDYFKERLSYVIAEGENPLILKENIRHDRPTLLIHGRMDEWVRNEQIRSLYRTVTADRLLIEYPDERHGCSFRMDDIIRAASDWYAS